MCLRRLLIGTLLVRVYFFFSDLLASYICIYTFAVTCVLTLIIYSFTLPIICLSHEFSTDIYSGNIPVIRDDSKTVPAFPEVSFIDVLDNDTPAPGGAPLRVVAILLRGVLPASGAVNPNGGNFVNNGNLNINSLEDFLQEHDVKLNNTSRAQPSLEQHAQPGERSLNGLCEPTSNRDRVRYTPDPGFQGQDRCAYRACDTNGICGEALIVFRSEPGADFHVYTVL